MKEIRRINKRRKTIEQNLSEIKNKTQQLKTKYEKLKSDHDALKDLAYRFMGGGLSCELFLVKLKQNQIISVKVF